MDLYYETSGIAQSVKSNTKCSVKKKEKNSTFSQKLAGEEVGFTHSHAALALCFVTPGALLEFLHRLKKKLGFSGHDKCTAHSSVMPTEEPDQTPADDVKP